MIARTLLGLAAGAALVFAATMPAAHATASGSFTKTCNVSSDEDYVVNASCKKKDGSYKGTSLAYRICQGDIWNDNGTLKCTPKGSFKNSCRNISWNTSFLTAECSKGGWPKPCQRCARGWLRPRM